MAGPLDDSPNVLQVSTFATIAAENRTWQFLICVLALLVMTLRRGDSKSHQRPGSTEREEGGSNWQANTHGKELAGPSAAPSEERNEALARTSPPVQSSSSSFLLQPQDILVAFPQEVVRVLQGYYDRGMHDPSPKLQLTLANQMVRRFRIPLDSRTL